MVVNKRNLKGKFKRINVITSDYLVDNDSIDLTLIGDKLGLQLNGSIPGVVDRNNFMYKYIKLFLIITLISLCAVGFQLAIFSYKWKIIFDNINATRNQEIKYLSQPVYYEVYLSKNFIVKSYRNSIGEEIVLDNDDKEVSVGIKLKNDKFIFVSESGISKSTYVSPMDMLLYVLKKGNSDIIIEEFGSSPVFYKFTWNIYGIDNIKKFFKELGGERYADNMLYKLFSKNFPRNTYIRIMYAKSRVNKNDPFYADAEIYVDNMSYYLWKFKSYAFIKDFKIDDYFYGELYDQVHLINSIKQVADTIVKLNK